MTLSVGDFRASAASLNANAEIKLKNDADGLATTGWQRFKVAVSDLFRGRETMAARQDQAIRGFMTALQREYGKDLGSIGVDHLRAELKGGPLTARAVQSTIDLMESRGGQNWLKNQRMAMTMAGTVFAPNNTTTPSLSAAVNPVANALLEEASSKGMPPNKVQEFYLRYTTGASQSGVGFEMEDVSHAIRTALAEAAVIRVGDDAGYKLLSPDDAMGIARNAAERTIRSRINLFMGSEFLKANSFEAAFDAKCHERGLDGLRDQMDVAPVKELFTYALQDARTVQGADELPATLDAVLNRYFDRQQEKLTNIEQMNLPPGTPRDNVVKESIGTRSRMDAGYFRQVENTAAGFAKLADALASATTPQEKADALLAVAGETVAQMNAADLEGADDMSRYLAQAFNVHAARGGMDTLEGLVASLGEDQEDVQDLLGEAMSDMDRAQLGSVAMYMMGVAGTLGRELLG